MQSMTLIQGIAALATALGLGTAIPALAKGLLAHMSGRAERERGATQKAIAERDGAWDREADIRDDLTEMKEYASRLRRVLIEAGYPEERIPAWPKRRTEED